MTTEPIEVGRDRPPFAMVPYWLMDASPHAIKLYFVLSSYADNTTRQAWPSRAKLAGHMGFKKADSLQPYIVELEALGAISVIRTRAADKTMNVNRYQLHYQPAEGTPVEGGTPVERGRGTPVQRGRVARSSGVELRTNELRTTELEPLFPAPASQAPAEAPADPIKDEARGVAKRLVELHPALKFMAMAKMAERMMRGYGVDGNTVGRTMDDLYRSGRTSLTDQVVGQALEGHRRPDGQSAAPRVAAPTRRMNESLSLLSPEGQARYLGGVAAPAPLGEITA